MFKPMLVTLVCTLSLLAQDITVSKDSLWVYNSNVSSRADQVIFTSSSPAPIHLDSAHIIVAEMDTTGLGFIPAGHDLEVAWKAGSYPYPYFTWTMDSIGAREFVLKKENFLPPEALPLSFAQSGDSARIALFSIGLCFNCNSLPRYPVFFRGILKLFFSNSQTIALRIYSDDLRKKTSAAVRRGSITTCMFLDSLDFSLINDSCQKRITLMQTCSFNTCAAAVPDVRIRVSSMTAPAGILYLGTSSDTGCLDTLKGVPQSGYLDSVGFGYSGGYLFAIKTSEGNYAALHLITSGSGVPFRYFKWVYQPDGSPVFIKETSARMPALKTSPVLRNVKSASRGDDITVSWTPVSGVVQCKLFDLNGRQMLSWQADGAVGETVARVTPQRFSNSVHILHLQILKAAETVCRPCVVLPR